MTSAAAAKGRRCEPPPHLRRDRQHHLSDGKVWAWVSNRWNRPGICITAAYAAEEMGLSWVARAESPKAPEFSRAPIDINAGLKSLTTE